MKVSETQFQAALIKRARLLGWRVFHVSDSRREVMKGGVSRLVGDELAKGWPDLVLVHPRRKTILFRELKSNTGRLSADQRQWIAALRAAGCDVDVWRPRDHARIDNDLGVRRDRR